jgi:hypothetical protein
MRTIDLAALAVTLAACGVGVDVPTEAFKDGFPRTATVELAVPGSTTSGQRATGPRVSRDALEGETAVFYGLTRSVTSTVNTAVAATLTVLERITENPATTHTESSATWGPFTNPLERNTWRFTVTRVGSDTYAYRLEGKGKAEQDSAYRTILSGQHASAGRAYGRGDFLIDWAAASTLPDHGADLGSATFSYARPSTVEPVRVDADFRQVLDTTTGQRVDAGYRFRQTPGQGGALEFQLRQDFFGGSAIEQLTVRSRWQASGAGRADVRLTGGDLPAPATAHECWDSSFLSRYFSISLNSAAGWGTEAACGFGTAEYASL